MSHRDQYKKYREVGQQLNSEILDIYSDQELILNSAEALGIEHDGVNMLYDFESDMTVHFEFMLYVYRRDGQTAAERYYEEERWDTDTKRTILTATLEAETSLFEIDAVRETDDRLMMTDILNGGEELSVLDINLSQTADSGVLLFFRPVRYEEFTATSGVSLPFPESEKEHLLNEYERRVNQIDSQSESLKRFVAFYDLYRDHGLHMQYG
jgi:hypothetical protein